MLRALAANLLLSTGRLVRLVRDSLDLWLQHEELPFLDRLDGASEHKLLVDCTALASKLNDLQNERSSLERQKASEENKNYDLGQKMYDVQSELDAVKVERKDLENYIGKLEAEVQKLRSMVDNVTQAECEVKEELSTFSKKAMMVNI